MTNKNKHLNISCPHCRNGISKAFDDQVKMRVKLVKWTHEGMFAVCKGCGKDVPIDLEFMKSIQLRFLHEISV